MSSHKSAKKQKLDDTQKRQCANLRTCATCHRDISSEIYVKCARCAGFNQCLECFSVGAEAQTHLRSHPFVLLEPILQPIFQKGWTAEQEILFLNAVQTCGLGNWHEIADLLNSKSAVECEAHYMETFIDGPTAPMPSDKILNEATLPPPPTFDTSPRESRPSISHEKNLQERGKKERTTPAEFAGWMPRRMEFEVEYMNDAEQMISGIKFEEGETPESLSRKLDLLRTYNEKLEERDKRTRFAVNWNLLDERDVCSFGGKTKSEKEMEQTLLPLAQIMPKAEFTTFIHSLQKEMRLNEKVETFKEWRKNGIVTCDEGMLYNQLKALRAEDKLSASAVDKWNRDVMLYAESPEFRATLDRQLLSASENHLCQSFGMSPHSYLHIKDLLLREFTVRGVMTREIAVSFMPHHEQAMVAIYESMRNVGLFYSIGDIGRIPMPGTPESREGLRREQDESGTPAPEPEMQYTQGSEQLTDTTADTTTPPTQEVTSNDEDVGDDDDEEGSDD